MRILILNTSDTAGGAAIASRRLMQALQKCGHEVRMLAMDKTTDSADVTKVGGGLLSKGVDRFRIFVENGLSTDKLWLTDAGFCGCGAVTKAAQWFEWADAIHLHWIGQGFLSLDEIDRILHCGKPVVWVLHDLWPLMGVCHHPFDCVRFESECRDCPQLCRASSHDLSNRVFKRKKRMYETADNLRFVAVSSWTAAMAERSALLGRHTVSVVPNVIDTDVALPDTKPQPYVVLFGAARIDHEIKGFSYLVQALRHIAGSQPEMAAQLRLITFGNCRNQSLLESIPIEHKHVGVVSEGRLQQLYAEATVVVSSSMYETFGQTLVEGALRGCVPVAFAGSGPDDIIEHCQSGYLARHLDSADLAKGILQAVAHSKEWGATARQHAIDCYSAEAVVKKLIAS